MTTSQIKAGILAASLLAGGAAQATQINGQINISGRGSVTLVNNGPEAVTLSNADAVVFPTFTTYAPPFQAIPGAPTHNASVSAALGDFAGTEGQLVLQYDFAWNPASTPVTPLWTTVSGPTWTFELTSITVDAQNENFLNLSGLGYFDDGIDDSLGGVQKTRSLGDWTFTITATDSLFTWTSSNAAPPRNQVPDNGGSLALLGGALLAAGMFRRKLAA